MEQKGGGEVQRKITNWESSHLKDKKETEVEKEKEKAIFEEQHNKENNIKRKRIKGDPENDSMDREMKAQGNLKKFSAKK